MSKRSAKPEPTTSRPTCCGESMPDPYRWKHFTKLPLDGGEPVIQTILFFRCEKCRGVKAVTLKPAHGDL